MKLLKYVTYLLELSLYVSITPETLCCEGMLGK